MKGASVKVALLSFFFNLLRNPTTQQIHFMLFQTFCVISTNYLFEINKFLKDHFILTNVPFSLRNKTSLLSIFWLKNALMFTLTYSTLLAKYVWFKSAVLFQNHTICYTWWLGGSSFKKIFASHGLYFEHNVPFLVLVMLMSISWLICCSICDGTFCS